MNFIGNLIRAVRTRLEQRRADRPERLRRHAEAKAYRTEMKRRHESDPRSGGGGGGM
jgi:hypothetical protein